MVNSLVMAACLVAAALTYAAGRKGFAFAWLAAAAFFGYTALMSGEWT